MHLEYREEIRQDVTILKNPTKVRVTFMFTDKLYRMNNL